MIAQILNKTYTSQAFVLEASAPLIHPYFPMSFNMSAGFVQLEPYIRGEKLEADMKIVTTQKCIRHFDLHRAGLDDSHLTFFEMWGALTVGATDRVFLISKLFEVLTKDFRIDVARLGVTVFGGDQVRGKYFDKDSDAYKNWVEVGMPVEQIYFGNATNTFWFQGGSNLDDATKGSPFENKLCGWQTEVYYNLQKTPCSKDCNPLHNCGNWLEVSNILNISHEYYPQEERFEPLKIPATETVIGLERLATVLQNKQSVWEIKELARSVESICASYSMNLESARIAVDRLRALLFLSIEGLPKPGRNGRNRIIKKMMRDVMEAFLKGDADFSNSDLFVSAVKNVGAGYLENYPELKLAGENLARDLWVYKEHYFELWQHCEESLKHLKLRGGGEDELKLAADDLAEKYGVARGLIGVGVFNTVRS